MSVIYRIKLYRSVIQLPFSYILVNWMAKLYPVFNFFDSRPGDMRRILEKGNSVVLTGATVQATICVKVTEFAFLETGFVYLTFLHCRIKRPPIKHMSHVFCPRFMKFLWNVWHQHLNPRYLWVIEEKGHRKDFAKNKYSINVTLIRNPALEFLFISLSSFCYYSYAISHLNSKFNIQYYLQFE